MPRNLYKYITLLTITLLVVSCQQSQNKLNVIDPSTFSDIDKGAYLSIAELRELIAENKNITLIDIRSISEYNESHLEGAIHIPIKDLMNDRTRTLISGSDQTIVIYGNTFQEIHGPFMLLNSLYDADLRILKDNYINYMNPDINTASGFDKAAFDFQKEWEDLMANTVIETPEGEIPNVAQTRTNVVPGSKKLIPVLPKKKKAAEEEGC